MREVGRGVRVFEAGPVQGALVTPGASAPATSGTDGVVLLVDDAAASGLPDLAASIAAVVCTAGDAGDPLARACERAGVPCAVAVVFDGPPPSAASLVVVDCSGDEGVVLVVDGGVAEGDLEDVVATQSPPA